MCRCFFLTIIAVMLGTSPALAEPFRLFNRSFDYSVEVYGSFNAPSDLAEIYQNNAKFELYVKPSLTLFKLSKNTTFVSYATFALIKDSYGFDYNNKYTFALGSEIRIRPNDTVKLAFGGKWKMEQEFATGMMRSAFVWTADASLYKTWQPRWLPGQSNSELVLSGWANLRHPGSLHLSERKNGQLQAFAKLAVAMPFRATRLKIAPFLSLLAKIDQKGRDFNNRLEPALGVELEIPVIGDGSVAIGAKTARQNRFATRTSSGGTSVYVKWYKRF
ncbi:hypothetical protein [Neptunicoccus sediminis]|uniref:hypothetical protein n=1 Tax=Neptunicoccus sediminis TaxID=1892596 RepID=UPI0008462288|nr:hypothetical protein [Neptunicoccus sediminis]